MPQSSRVTVIGAGYVGLVTAVGLGRLGHSVDLVENRSDRLASLRQGRVPFHESGVQDLLTELIGLGLLRITDIAPTVSDVVMICVGTPIGSDGLSDLAQLHSALKAVDERLQVAAPLVIRSTLPPGSSAVISDWTRVPTSRILSNPEFLRQGTALQDFMDPDRIVIGHFPDVEPGIVERVTSLYGGIDAPRIVVDMPAAELIKNGANSFLALKLSFANEIAAMCEEFGTDAGSVLEAIGLDPRIGVTYMRPGFGFGGSCLPKELRAMTTAGRRRGLPMLIASAASEANEASQRRFVGRIVDELGSTLGRRVALLGLAFKAGTDDVRDSPALAVAEQLTAVGVDVVAFDPVAEENARRALPNLRVVPSAAEAMVGADAVVIATEWPEFRDLDWVGLREVVAAPLVLDGRRLLDPVLMAALGYRVIAVGRGLEPRPLRTGEVATR